MSSVVDWLTSIGESIWEVSREIIGFLGDIISAIGDLAINIVDGIGDFFATLFDYLNPFSENFILKDITNFFIELLDYLNPFSENFILKIFFDWLKDLLKDIFVPDTEVINGQFNSTLENLKGRLGITMYNLDNLFSSSASPNNIESDYNIHGVGTLKLKFANYDFLVQGVNFFRPYIRGLIVLLLFFFNIRQLMSMFGLDTGEMTNWVTNSRGREDK